MKKYNTPDIYKNIKYFNFITFTHVMVTSNATYFIDAVSKISFESYIYTKFNRINWKQN